MKGQHDGTDPRDTLARGRIETARTVLGSEQTRKRYDQMLVDPAAPPITEAVLADLAAEAKKRRSIGDWVAVGIGVVLGT